MDAVPAPPNTTAIRLYGVLPDGQLLSGRFPSNYASNRARRAWQRNHGGINFHFDTKTVTLSPHPGQETWQVSLHTHQGVRVASRRVASWNRAQRFYDDHRGRLTDGGIAAFVSQHNPTDNFTFEVPGSPRLSLPTEEQIRAISGSVRFERGHEYQAQGLVPTVNRNGNILSATVGQDTRFSYQVTVTLLPPRPLTPPFAYSCSCPDFRLRALCCKHVVALILKARLTNNQPHQGTRVRAVIPPETAFTEGYGLLLTRDGETTHQHFTTLRELRSAHHQNAPRYSVRVRDYGTLDDHRILSAASRLSETPIPGKYFLSGDQFQLVVMTNPETVFNFPSRNEAQRARGALSVSRPAPVLEMRPLVTLAGPAPAPELGLTPVPFTIDPPPVLSYLTDRGELYQFRFIRARGLTYVGQGAETWAAFIVTCPSYGNRLSGILETHRIPVPPENEYSRFGSHYCCWSNPLASEREARGMAVSWMQANSRYQRDGTPF